MTADFIIIYPPATLVPDGSARFMPLGGLYLADALSKAGYSSAIIDDDMAEIPISLKNAAGNQTIAFGISTLSGTQLKNAISVAKFLRNNFPNKPIIWGGAHVTALPTQTLESELTDFVVWGEGEQSLPKLLQTIQNKGDFSEIKGIGYKSGGKSIVTVNHGYTPLENQVFKLPYHLLDMKKYQRKMAIGMNRNLSIFSSRGCPFRCKFCSNSSKIWPNTKLRYHSIDHVINDVTTLVNSYNTDGITISDENLFVNEDRLISVCRALQKQNFALKYRTAARADLLSRLQKSTWSLLKDTGFVAFGVGIESGSQRILNYIGKGITLEQIFKVDALLTKYHLYKTYNFMTCVPGETINDVRETLRLILALAKTSKYCPYPFGMLHKFIPLPGTELFDAAIQHGFKPPTSLEGWTGFDDFNNTNPQILSVIRPWLSNELLSYVDEANRLIERLNALYTGSNLNEIGIEQAFCEIQALINKTT